VVGSGSTKKKHGELLIRAPQHQEALSLVEIDMNQLHRTRARLPLLRDERTGLIQKELNRILEHQIR
jgi:predicted amidohydrolase